MTGANLRGVRLIVSGTRHRPGPHAAWSGALDVAIALLRERGMKIESIVHGGCPTGVDQWANHMAGFLAVPVEVFRADWALHGKAAGPIRNREMARAGDALLALPCKHSRGTRHMIKVARARGLEPIMVTEIECCGR